MAGRLVYSTDPSRQPCPRCGAYPCECPGEPDLRPPGEQDLRVRVDRKARKGKAVTLVEGFVGPDPELQDLARTLKKKCGAGGSAREGTIEIQGEKPDEVRAALKGLGYRVR